MVRFHPSAPIIIKVINMEQEELTINWDVMIHPDLEAIAKRDEFLSDENGELLNAHMRVFWPDIDED